MTGNRFFRGALFAALAMLSACSSTAKTSDTVAPAPALRTPAPQANAGRKEPNLKESATAPNQGKSSLDALRSGAAPTTPAGSALREVYFDFDSFDLSPEARTTLKSAADWLKQNPAVKVSIEGHCDERGTTEYNLALGAKRAQAAQDYLVNLGIAAGRLSTISYGEEIPVCRESNEGCWQKNRRDRFVSLAAKAVN